MFARTPFSIASGPRYAFHSQTAMPKYGLPASTVRFQPPSGEPDQRTHVALLVPTGPDRLQTGLHQLRHSVGQLAPAQHARRGEQPRHVLLEPEHRRPARRPVAANSLEDADAVVQRRGQEVQLGIRRRHQLAVQPHWRSLRLLRLHVLSCAVSPGRPPSARRVQCEPDSLESFFASRIPAHQSRAAAVPPPRWGAPCPPRGASRTWGRPAWFSRIHSRANAPVWISRRIRFISAARRRR